MMNHTVIVLEKMEIKWTRIDSGQVDPTNQVVLIKDPDHLGPPMTCHMLLFHHNSHLRVTFSVDI